MFSSDEFLDAFSKDRRYFIPLPFLWKVTIDGITADAINRSITKAGEKWRCTDIPNSYVKHNNILVAQEVTLPNELYTLGATTINNAGAFLPGYTVNELEFLTFEIVAVTLYAYAELYSIFSGNLDITIVAPYLLMY